MKTLIIVVEFDDTVTNNVINEFGSEMTTTIDLRLQEYENESLSTQHFLVTGKFAIRCPAEDAG